MSRQLSGIVLVLALCSATSVQAAPKLWGAGVEGCFTYNKIYSDHQEKGELGSRFYPRYREWLMGLVSGLSAATGLDMLYATEPDAAMKRIQLICEQQPNSDFFNATMLMFSQMSIPGAAEGQFAPREGRQPTRTETPATQSSATIETLHLPKKDMIPVEPTVRALESGVPTKHEPAGITEDTKQKGPDSPTPDSSVGVGEQLNIATHSISTGSKNCGQTPGQNSSSSSIAMDVNCR